ncbi:DNA polymerase delta subunit 3 isoform X2 [Neoarius graeffei]|uniref:DNA polymerase delta subunit 3 isoform X2 n=1 Tax=Neoarius graeffei TaxID=443677 RepID=UPI00298C58E9|nr:DNA polymerase delta subunit 3 isoform X2 [Neoarius graeffei]
MQGLVCFQGDQLCSTMDDLYLDNIDEYVNDQNKIVTYKWLSLTLGVHVNTAKQMLYHYIEQRRKERSGNTLHATYLVSGKCFENGSVCHKVSVVREDKLEDVKSKLDVTISVHVYSVQKAELKDSAPLYSTDYDAMKENLKNCNKYSAIRCAAAVPMSPAELQRVQEKAMSTAIAKDANKPVVSSYTAPASKPTSNQPKGIMGMFSSKAAPKSEEQNKEVKMEQMDDPSPAEEPKTKLPSKAAIMNNFFGKSADKKLDKPDKNIKKADGVPISSAAGSTKQTCISSKLKQDMKEELPKEADVIKDDSKEIRSKMKRLEHLDSEDEQVESQKKKRRRIKNPQPDSSDDEDSPPAPEVQTSSPVKHVKNEPVSQKAEGRRRKRRRVLKSRTFVDEEGCIVTEKGYETESYSESEDESKGATQPSDDSSSLKQPLPRMDEEKKVEEKSQKKAAANKATKQASIMGFFQKK